MYGAIDVRVTAASDRFDPLDPRWLKEVGALARELTSAGPDLVVRPATPQPGTKGIPVEIVLACTSAASLLTLRTLVLAWLRRDKSRRVERHINDGKREQTIVLTADRMDNDAFERIAQSVADRIGGS